MQKFRAKSQGDLESNMIISVVLSFIFFSIGFGNAGSGNAASAIIFLSFSAASTILLVVQWRKYSNEKTNRKNKASILIGKSEKTESEVLELIELINEGYIINGFRKNILVRVNELFEKEKWNDVESKEVKVYSRFTEVKDRLEVKEGKEYINQSEITADELKELKRLLQKHEELRVYKEDKELEREKELVNKSDLSQFEIEELNRLLEEKARKIDILKKALHTDPIPRLPEIREQLRKLVSDDTLKKVDEIIEERNKKYDEQIIKQFNLDSSASEKREAPPQKLETGFERLKAISKTTTNRHTEEPKENHSKTSQEANTTLEPEYTFANPPKSTTGKKDIAEIYRSFAEEVEQYIGYKKEILQIPENPTDVSQSQTGQNVYSLLNFQQQGGLYIGTGELGGLSLLEEASSTTDKETFFLETSKKMVDNMFYAFRDIDLSPDHLRKAFLAILEREMSLVALYTRYNTESDPATRNQILNKLFESDEQHEVLTYTEPKPPSFDKDVLDPSDIAKFGKGSLEIWNSWGDYNKNLLKQFEELISFLIRYFPEYGQLFLDNYELLIRTGMTMGVALTHYQYGSFIYGNPIGEGFDQKRAKQRETYYKEKKEAEKAIQTLLYEYSSFYYSFYPEEDESPFFIDYKTFLDSFKIKDRDKRPEFVREIEPTLEGYLQYMGEFEYLCKALNRFSEAERETEISKSFPVYIPETELQKHIYITGGSGSGKSELLKVLIHNQVKNGNSSNIILDPHGDFCSQVAQWEEFADNDRLILVEPNLEKNFSPIINPFDITLGDEEEINLAVEDFLSSFKEIMRQDNSELTYQMETILMPCIDTIIRNKKTFLDLQRFLVSDQNSDLVALGLRSPHPAHRNFFKTAFRSKTFEETKKRVYARIQKLLNSQGFFNLVNGNSTFNLEKAIEEKKTIIFNLSKGKIGRETSSVFGRLIVSMLSSLAYRRDSIPIEQRTPTYIFIDECHQFITDSIETILNEARKYKVFLILAQQYAGQSMSEGLKKSIRSNTGIKFCGKNEDEGTLKNFASATNANLSDLKSLSTAGAGKFFMKCGSSLPFPVQIHDQLIGSKNKMNNEDWERTKQQQIEKYYRDVFAELEKEAETALKPKYEE